METERKRAQKALRESEAVLSLMLDNAPVVMMLVDRERRVRKLNDATVAFTGRPREEMIGLRGGEALRCLHSLDDPQGCGFGPFCQTCPVRLTVLDTFETGKSHHHVEARLPFSREERERETVLLVSTTLVSVAGTPMVLVTVDDITERKQAEEEISRLAKFPSENPNSVLRVARDGTVIYANEAALPLLNVWGCQEGQSLPDYWRQFILDVFSSGSSRDSEVEYENRILSLTFAPVVDADYVNVYGLDITERKHAEQALRESRDYLEKLTNSMGDAVFSVRMPERVIEWANDSFRLIGYEPEEYVGRTTEFLYPDRNEFLGFGNKLKKAIDAGEDILHAEQSLRRKNGEVFPAEITTTIFKEKGEVVRVTSIVRDITERKRAEEELQQSFEKLRKALGGTIQAMALTVETRDPYTAGHQRRVTNLARAIADEMGLSAEQINGIRMAGSIHDLGKISVPGGILNRPGRLTENEFAIIQTHPQVGYDILKTIEFPWPVAQIAHQHHERMDGSGYPQGLSGEEILLEARILAVADVVEAMSSHRPYRPALGIEKALEEILQNRGVLYDPGVVDACLKVFAEKGFDFG